MYFISLKKICVGCFFKYNAQRLKNKHGRVETVDFGGKKTQVGVPNLSCIVLNLCGLQFLNLENKENNIYLGGMAQRLVLYSF